MPFHSSRTADGATAAAVSRLLPDLAPAAVLIADDPDDAVRLLGAALGAPRALDDLDGARRALVGHLDARPRWSAEQVIETAGPAAPTDDDAALAAALRALPERQRAAVVLEGDAADGWQEAVARLRSDLARRDEDERLDRRQAAALYRAPGSAPLPEQAVVPLPERLALLAAGRPLPPGAAEAIAAAIGEARGARRRRRLRIAGGAAMAALLLALTPLLPRGVESPPTVYGEATRGGLAGDEDFLAAMSEAPWPGAPGTADSRVVFADDVPGGRWALVAAGGSRSRPAAIAWFTGPPGAPADRMILTSFRTSPDPALPAALTDPSTGALVVVGAPGDRFTVSARPDVGVDGSVSRTFRSLRAPEGVAVAGLTPVPGATVSAARLQVTRDDRRLDVRPRTVLGGAAGSRAELPVRALRPAPSWAGDTAVTSRLRMVFGQLGQVALPGPVTALWSGELPGVNDQPTRLSVLAIEQPSGAYVVTAPYSYTAAPTGATGSSWCATGVLPAGLPLEQRAVAVRCDLRDQTRGELYRFLVVIGPRTAVSAQLVDGRGAVLSEHRLTDGVAVIRSPGDVAEVFVSTAAGRSERAVPFVDSALAE